MKSIFTDQSTVPTEADLQAALGDTYAVWQDLAAFVKNAAPWSEEGWHFSGEKYGWSFRIRDKKRVLAYLLPRAGFFKLALVFGPKATEAVLASDVPDSIQAELRAAKPYAEGRGIRLSVVDGSLLPHLHTLISIKISA